MPLCIYVTTDIYYSSESKGQALVWLHGELKTPPLGKEAPLEAGLLLRRLQQGELLSMPQSRPMPSIGARCHELRVNDASSTWRIVYRLDRDAIVILEVFAKKIKQTPAAALETCRKRLREYDRAGK